MLTITARYSCILLAPLPPSTSFHTTRRPSYLLELGKVVISTTAECKRHPHLLPFPLPPPANTDLHASWSLAWGDQHHCRVLETQPRPLPGTPSPRHRCSLELLSKVVLIITVRGTNVHFISHSPLPSTPPPPLPNTDLHASWGLAREWSASLQEAPCPLPFTYPPPPPSSSKHRPPCLLELGKGVLIITTRGTHAHNTVVLLPGSYTTCLTAVFHLPKDLSFNVIHT